MFLKVQNACIYIRLAVEAHFSFHFHFHVKVMEVPCKFPWKLFCRSYFHRTSISFHGNPVNGYRQQRGLSTYNYN
jgi:hypothetical protein